MARGPGIVVVLGARGGRGSSTLALDLGWRAAALAPAGGTLVVDSDEDHPSLDLRLGAAKLDEDLWPSARLDHVLLRLPELATGSVDLGRLLWSAGPDRLAVMLASAYQSRLEAGPEHLDYLYRYHLAPRFGTVIVDGGSPGQRLSVGVRFWLGKADWLLVCLRGGTEDLRACRQLLALAAVAPRRSRTGLVIGAASARAADRLLGPLHEVGAVHWTRPWIPHQALLAERRCQPLSDVDRRVRAQTEAMVRVLSSSRVGPDG